VPRSFDLADGSVKCPPAEEGVGCYRVEVQGEDIKIEIP
jgi:nitrite reductase/ring-hydroxylating ferredoxin subunit